MKKAVYILLAVLFLPGLSAYGQNTATLSGKYYLTGMEMEGYVFDDAMMAMMDINPADWYIDFLSGGKCVMHMDNDSSKGTFTVEGNFLTITDDEGAVDTGVVEGNKVLLANDEVRMIFEKR